MNNGYAKDLGSYGADGDFGSCTLKAVKNYQSAHGLTADGIVGNQTWAKMFGSGSTTSGNAKASGGKEIIVQSGMTLSQIAKNNGVTVSDLARENGISNPNVISVGQKIRIPSGSGGSSGGSRQPVSSIGNNINQGMGDTGKINDNDGIVTKENPVLLALTTAYNGAKTDDDRKAILTLEDNVRNDSVDISDVKTTVINGVTYLDYSEAVNTMLINDATEANKHHNDLGWFNSMEKSGAPWDIKLQKNWVNDMPNTLYLGVSGTFVTYGQAISADDLGNLHYGYVGRAANYGIEFLSLAAGAANIRDNSKVSLPV